MFSQIFPLKDTTLYSDVPTQNTGLDSILEVTKPTGYNSSRILIQFDSTELKSTIDQITGSMVSGNWKAYLRMYASEAESIPTELNLLVDPVGQEWDMGTGKRGNSPYSINGASWNGPKEGSLWQTSSLTTASFMSGSTGGGTWYTGYTVSQSISQTTTQDVWTDVTSIVGSWYNSTIPNYGLEVRVTSSIENSSNYTYKLSWFSRDTNTIFPPSLIFYWNTQTFTSSGSLVLTDEEFDVTLGNNDGVYYNDSNVKFRLYSRETYPKRIFVTSSLYEYNKVLPQSSYYQIVDVDTNETIIPFNNPGTLVNGDNKSSFITVNMNTLEPNRYYSVQLKTVIDGGTYVKNISNSTFKVNQTV